AIDPALDLHAALDTTTQPVLGPEQGDELDIRRGVQQVDPASAVGGDCGLVGEEPDTPAAYEVSGVAQQHLEAGQDCRYRLVVANLRTSRRSACDRQQQRPGGEHKSSLASNHRSFYVTALVRFPRTRGLIARDAALPVCA